MNISNIQHLTQYNSALENIASTLIQRKSDTLASANNSSGPQKASGDSEPENVTPITDNPDKNPFDTSPEKLLNQIDNTYQWEVNELSTYRDQLLSDTHYDPMSNLTMPTSPSGDAKATEISDPGIILDSSAAEQFLGTPQTSAPEQNSTTPQDWINFITGSATSFTSSWISQINQASSLSSSSLIETVQDATNESMGKNYDWTNVSSKSIGLGDVGTDTVEIVLRINQAISILNGYCGAISTVLGTNPNIPRPSTNLLNVTA